MNETESIQESRPRVVIVEDDPDFGYYMSLLMRTKVGTDVELYTDGLEGLLACINDPPDLAILDLELPTMRGEEILRRLRSSPHTRAIPILICSSMPEPQKRELEVLLIGADRYLEKPFIDERFLQTVVTLLSQPRVVQTPVVEEVAELAPVLGETKDKNQPAAQGAVEAESYKSDNSDPAKSSVFAGFRILGLLGGGGMGSVYEAWHPDHGHVAIKVLLKALTSNPNAVERFIREGRTMEALDHPNIIRIYGSGRTAYSYYIVMELVEGRSLDRLIDEHALMLPEKVDFIRQAFDAIIYLHSKGVIHRDLKPSNFIVDRHSKVKLGDFGISWNPVLGEGARRLTRDASLVGTPAFMAPEQLGGAEATESTDQYSLARTLLCLFEEARPTVPPQPLHVTRPDLPRALSDTLLQMMDLHPARRYPSLIEAKVAMLKALEGIH